MYPLTAAPASLDPQKAVDETAGLVVEQLYEGLFHLRGDGTIEPAAATGYTVSPDSQTYTVTLRSDLTWSDGAPLTAQHYVDGLCRLLEPATGNSYYYLLTEVLAITGRAISPPAMWPIAPRSGFGQPMRARLSHHFGTSGRASCPACWRFAPSCLTVRTWANPAASPTAHISWTTGPRAKI